MCQQCGNNSCGGCQPQIPAGQAGAAGKNAYNFTTASFTMPSANTSPATEADVLVSVRSTGQFANTWMIPGQVVYITGAGYFTVQSLTGNNQVTVRNLGYTGNGTPGATIASGATVSPSGLQGIQGIQGEAAVNGIGSIYSDSTNSSTATLTKLAIKTAPIAGATLVDDGDALLITVLMNHTRTTYSGGAFDDNFGVEFAGTTLYVGGALPVAFEGDALGIIRITKTSASTARVEATVSGWAFSGNPLTGVVYASGTTISDLAGQDFTISNNLTVYSVQTLANAVVCKGLYVEKVKA
jgi:hypothetical protein